MIKRLKQNQSGAVALITVIFMALLLTVMTTSFIRITINEQRQATDDDLTKRAFFAAESGIEDAKIALDMYLKGRISKLTLKGDECGTPAFLEPVIEDGSDGIQASYTCQLISTEGPSYRSEIDAWDSRTIPLRAVDSTGTPVDFNTMTLRWHDPVVDGNYSLRASGADNFPNTSSWGTSQFPALIRIQITSYPTGGGGSFEADEVTNYVVFVNPESGAVASTQNFTNANIDGSLLKATCTNPASTPAGSYACKVTLNGFSDSSRNSTVRVTSLYRKANVEIVLNDGDVDMADASAVIDVTARAGDVYRRVQAVVGLTPEDLLPDAALTSRQDVCKNFFVTDNIGEFQVLNPGADPARLCQ